MNVKPQRQGIRLLSPQGNSTTSGVSSVVVASTTASSAWKPHVIDETLLPPKEAKKLMTRRANNRECATRARKRTKQLVETLQNESKKLENEKSQLKRINDALKTRLDLLEQQNHNLMVKESLSKEKGQVAARLSMELQQKTAPAPNTRQALRLNSDLLRKSLLQPGIDQEVLENNIKLELLEQHNRKNLMIKKERRDGLERCEEEHTTSMQLQQHPRSTTLLTRGGHHALGLRSDLGSGASSFVAIDKGQGPFVWF